MKFYAIGYDIHFSSMNYRLDQKSSSKIVPNNIKHDKEKLRFNNLGIELYNRFNVGRRGDRVGQFIDLGGCD